MHLVNLLWILLALGVSNAVAQPAPVIAFENITVCTKLQWNPVVDEGSSGLKGYRVFVVHDQSFTPPAKPPYVDANGADLTFVEVDAPTTEIPCGQLDLRLNTSHVAFVVAVDHALNISRPSKAVSWMLLEPDPTAPGAPGDFCFVGQNVSGDPVLVCP